LILKPIWVGHGCSIATYYSYNFIFIKLIFYSPFCVTAKVTKLIGLKNGGRVSPTNLVTFAGTQNGESVYFTRRGITDCNNYRGICMLTTAYKVLSRFTYPRIEPEVDRVLGEYQAGFLKSRSTADY
jgi:hypothetical protein